MRLHIKNLSMVVLVVLVHLTVGVAGAGADTIYVPGDYPTIQEGIDAAEDGDEVVVADGTYTGPLNKNLDFGGRLITVRSEFGPDNCIIDCEGDGRGFYFHSGETAQAVVQGLTIRNGYVDEDSPGGDNGGGVHCYESSPTLTDCTITGNTSSTRGGGVYCRDSSPTLINCTITGNWVDWVGGGVYCSGESNPTLTNCTIADNSCGFMGAGAYFSSSSPTLTNCTFTGNTAEDWGAGVHCSRSSPTLTDCTFTDNMCIYGFGAAVCCEDNSSATLTRCTMTGNSAHGGGGIYCYASSPTLTDCTFAGNLATRGWGYGGALFCFDGANPTLTNCTITSNAAIWGGGVYCSGDSSPTVTNCTIAGNSAGDDGGGMHCSYGGNSTLTNCTITGNSAAGYQGGGVYCYESSPTLTNCILWNDSPQEISVASSSPVVTHCDVEGGWAGEGNIDADPMFANPAAGDWHLTYDSPCIDAGNNAAPNLPEYDWDGEARIAKQTVDMGADEYVTYYTEAPDPQPECDGPLFGASQTGFPAWVWFSIPLTPDCVVGAGCADPNELLGFECDGRLWYLDKYLKSAQVYQPPFLTWDLAVGDGYLLYLEADVANPSYEGITPFIPWTFEFKLGRMGWTWVGMPGLAELTGDAFMDSVGVVYPSDETGEYRTANEDYEATPDNWVSWGWPYWNTWAQAPETFTPYAPFGHNTCYPWVGYRCWINVGTAMSEDDPDQVTLIWPKVE